jgi:putative transposase
MATRYRFGDSEKPHFITSSVVKWIDVFSRKQLADVMRDMKKFTSQRIIAAIEANLQESRRDWLLWMFKRAGALNKNNETYQFWQQDNHPIELSTNEMIHQRLDYLHNNPVKAGYVWEPQHYKYSSAIDYYTDEKGLLPLKLLF